MKYKHFENNEINNISTGERDANGVVIPTNALDSMMKQYLPMLDPMDYVLRENEVDVDTTHDGIRTLQSYLIEMKGYIDTDTMNEDGTYQDTSDADRETQIFKGFQMLLAVYDVMNRNRLGK